MFDFLKKDVDLQAGMPPATTSSALENSAASPGDQGDGKNIDPQNTIAELKRKLSHAEEELGFSKSLNKQYLEIQQSQPQRQNAMPPSAVQESEPYADVTEQDLLTLEASPEHAARAAMIRQEKNAFKAKKAHVQLRGLISEQVRQELQYGEYDGKVNQRYGQWVNDSNSVQNQLIMTEFRRRGRTDPSALYDACLFVESEHPTLFQRNAKVDNENKSVDAHLSGQVVPSSQGFTSEGTTYNMDDTQKNLTNFFGNDPKEINEMLTKVARAGSHSFLRR